MIKNKRGLFILMVLAVTALLACNLPFSAATQETAQESPTATAPVSGLGQTIPSSAAPTTMPNSTANLEPTITLTAKPADLTGVAIGLADLPKGFSELDATSQKQIGVTQDTVAGMFQGSFSEAKPTNFFSFLNANPDTYQFVLGTLFTPLTESEVVAFDNLLDDPAKAMQSFTAGMGGKADILQGANTLGEKSIGFTFTTDVDTMTLRGDMILARRKGVVILVLSMYQDGTQPPTQAIALATVLDNRLQEALSR